MKQFLSIVLRNQFNLFYRFGYTVIPKIGLVEFDGNINDETKESIIKQFANVTPFEYDEEYLILHFEKEINNNEIFLEFQIQELVAVYPLSQQAKTSIESKIDQRIKLEKPIFETKLSVIETAIANKEVEKAISALWLICKVEGPLEKYIAKISLENILNGLEYRKNGTKLNKIQNGNYWEYLIAYDRFDYFPNTTLGYFYDTGQVFAFSKGLTSFEGSAIHSFLEKLNSSNAAVKLPDIIKYFEAEEQLKGYVNQTTIGELKQYIIAPLYLMLRDEIRKSDDISQTKLFKNLEYLKKFGDNFNYAIILLGAFFGFRKFYDNYYEILNLRFYKSYKAEKKESAKEEHVEQVINNLKNNITENFAFGKMIEEEKLSNKSGEEDNIGQQTFKTKIEELKHPHETPNVQTSLNENKENKPDISSQYENIIQVALLEQSKIKIADIVKIIKEQTGQSAQVGIVENVAKQMIDVEIIKIGRAKGIIKKGTINILFNQ